MRIETTLMTLLCVVSSATAATVLKGTVVDAQTGRPIPGANVLLRGQSQFAVTDVDGAFVFGDVVPGKDVLEIIATNYDDRELAVDVAEEKTRNVGEIKMTPADMTGAWMNQDNLLFSEEDLSDDEGMSQGVGSIQGATDNIYYKTASYNFSTAWFRMRGYDRTWETGYINGFNMNDAMRGQFNFSMLGGMTSSAFRNRTTEIGQSAANYGYGSIGGSNNFTTYASEFAPGWKGNLSYTNSNYMLRAMLQYSTGLNKHGWAFSASVIGRYAPEGVIEGTFYNSFGYFLSLQKIFNDKHSLNLSTWGAPTQRATNAAVTQEAYDLAGSNYYNPSWGYLDGKKKSSRIRETFDPSVMLNWIYKPFMGTRLNTGLAFRSNHYNSTGINWYQAADPRPDYYRNLPYYYAPTVTEAEDPDLYAMQLAQQQYVADWWGGDKSHRQLNWNQMYQTNLLNKQQYDRDPEKLGHSTYVLENSHSNFNSYMLNSYIDTRLTDLLSLQGGVSFNYTDASYYKTMRDLLGGDYWLDIDNFSERDFVGNPDIMQNDLDNPNREIKEGDKFGYDYNIHNINTRVWVQNQINTRHWNISYAAEFSYTNFWRYGHMRNGRAPGEDYIKAHPEMNLPNSASFSKGKGSNHEFYDGGVKAGATYKLDGRNYFTGHVGYGSRSPLPDNSYVYARIKDEAVKDLRSETYLSADLSYTWNYKNFRGSLTGFYTRVWDGMKRMYFYDYDLQSMMSYTMSGIDTEYMGLELGMEYKILPNLSLSAVGTIADYRYKNNPDGVRSYQNGSQADVERKVYLKNYHVGGTPQQVVSFAANYNVKQWFFEVNAQWFGDGYFELSPSRHEYMPGLWKFCFTQEEYEKKRDEIAYQDKLNCEWVMNLSVGKVIYTKFGSVNINLSVNNLLNNRNIQVGARQEGKFDYTNYDVNKFSNKLWYAQGIRVFLNLGIRF